jgi:cobalt-zinc-cadmium efflux system outer membrane protein
MLTRILHLLTFLTAVPALAPVAIAAGGGVSLTLDGVGDRVRRHNPQLAAARLRIEEAHGRLEHAGRLTNPDLDFDFAQNIRTPEHAFRVDFIQRFPLTGRLRLEKAVSRAQLAAAEAEVRDVERKLATDARVLAVKLLALRQQRAVRVKQIANSRELGAFLLKRVATGEASLVDSTQVQLERGQLGTSLLLLESEQAALLGELRPLLGMRAAALLEITGELPMPGGTPKGAVDPERRGDYQAAQHGAEAAKESAALAKANKWADIGVGLTADFTRSEDAPDGLKRDTMVGLKFSLPLPLWNANEGRIREANAAAIRTEKEVAALAAQIRGEVAGARGEMAGLAKVIASIADDLIPQATQIEEQRRTSYGIGQTAFIEVVRARGGRFELEVQLVTALRDYHLARTRYLAATGTTEAQPKPAKRK